MDRNKNGGEGGILGLVRRGGVGAALQASVWFEAPLPRPSLADSLWPRLVWYGLSALGKGWRETRAVWGCLLVGGPRRGERWFWGGPTSLAGVSPEWPLDKDSKC